MQAGNLEQVSDRQYLEVDEDGGSQYPQTLQQISQHMHESCSHTGVPQGEWLPLLFLQGCILRPTGPMAVRGASLVQHEGHSAEEEQNSWVWAASSWALLPSLVALPPPISPRHREKEAGPREANNVARKKEDWFWCQRHGVRSGAVWLRSGKSPGVLAEATSLTESQG